MNSVQFPDPAAHRRRSWPGTYTNSGSCPTKYQRNSSADFLHLVHRGSWIRTLFLAMLGAVGLASLEFVRSLLEKTDNRRVGRDLSRALFRVGSRRWRPTVVQHRFDLSSSHDFE